MSEFTNTESMNKKDWLYLFAICIYFYVCLYFSIGVLELVLLIYRYSGLHWWLSNKESPCSAGDGGDMGSIPWLGRTPGGGHGNHSSNTMDRGTCWLQSMGPQRVGHDWSNRPPPHALNMFICHLCHVLLFQLICLFIFLWYILFSYMFNVLYDFSFIAYSQKMQSFEYKCFLAMVSVIQWSLERIQLISVDDWPFSLTVPFC